MSSRESVHHVTAEAVVLNARQQAALIRLVQSYGRERDQDWMPSGWVADGIEAWYRLYPDRWGQSKRVAGWNAYRTAKALVARNLVEESHGFLLRTGCDWQAMFRATDAGVRWLAEHGIREYGDLPAPDDD